MSFLRRFGRFWWEFVVGDEWRIALVVAIATGLGALAAMDHRVDGRIIAIGVAAGVMAAVCEIIVGTGRRSRR
ncbi:MAG TPA: hypothetical protein VGK92_06300 [Gaiellales bacterium]